jgi:type I restriction enzyme R subunit
LAKLGRLAERYFPEDPPTSLVKLRQFAEMAAREAAARQALLPNAQTSFDDILRVLRARSVLQRKVAELFYRLQRQRT